MSGVAIQADGHELQQHANLMLPLAGSWKSTLAKLEWRQDASRRGVFPVPTGRRLLLPRVEICAPTLQRILANPRVRQDTWASVASNLRHQTAVGTCLQSP